MKCPAVDGFWPTMLFIAFASMPPQSQIGNLTCVPSPVQSANGASTAGSSGKSLKPTAKLPDEDVEHNRSVASHLLALVDEGKLVLANRGRETAQLMQLAANGTVAGSNGTCVRMASSLLDTLDRLADSAEPTKPLVLVNLYRPSVNLKGTEPHSNGLAMDIGAYGGHILKNTNADECLEAVLAIIKALGPGNYRFGLPVPQDSEMIVLMPAPLRTNLWPFFPPPLPNVIGYFEIVAPKIEDGQLVKDIHGELKPAILKWEFGRYAPIADIGSSRLKEAIEDARGRGVNIHSLFPDAKDHLHIDVKPQP